MEAKFDFNRFMKRLGLKQKDAADLLKVSKGLVGMWALPSYDKTVRLIVKGITAQELFGDELGSFLLENSKIASVSTEYQEGYKKGIAELKEKGFLRDEILKTIAEMKENGKL